MKGDLLEFNSVKGYIKNYVVSDAGSGVLENLCPYNSWDDAVTQWELTSEMTRLIINGMISINQIADISPLMEMKEGAVFEGQDLLKVSSTLKEISRLKSQLENEEHLSRLTEAIMMSSPLIKEIENSLLPTGEVSDLRNPVLKQMRIRYRSLRQAALEKLENIISSFRHIVTEEIITIRNNRFVIPFRHDFGVHIKGITHDYSGSRHSVYVEPFEVVEDNNSLIELKSGIREEEERVLRHLTTQVIRESDNIKRGISFFALVDVLQAVARWSIRTGSFIPVLGDEISLVNARHPVLLESLGNSCRPLDIRLPSDKNCLIITGPNAGGKTVALKTLGLLVLMAKSGLPVPADKGSIIPRIRSVLVEMDTSQDISHGLSTFTAHVKSLKDIYDSAGPGDMVLLDEPGTGTDHDHGGAIAAASIDAYRKKGAVVVVTSHSETVKLYGLSQTETQIAAMSFDESTLKPLYSIQYGVIGSSRAFEILKSVSFPEALIDEAEGIIAGKGNNSLMKAMEDFSMASKLKLEAQMVLNEANILKDSAEKEIRLQVKERFESALKYKRLLEKLESLIDRPEKNEFEAVKELPEAVELDETLIDLPVQAANVFGFSKGMRVRIINTKVSGVITSLESETAEITSGSKRITVNIDQIEPAVDETGKASRTKHIKSFAPSLLPIIIVGMRVDEALPIIEKAIDNAILSGQETLEIIHGSGSGILKKAVRAYLKEAPNVKGFQDARPEDSGGSKTIVRFN
jgi:DNA mismatch repair protein MutS2